MAVPAPDARLTEAEYLDIERRAEIKSEFFDGQMFAMAGGTRQHSLIGMNIGSELRAKLKGKCVVFNSDMRVKVEVTGLFTYPDVSVVCGEQRFLDEDTLLNPTLVVEVLSESTEAYDRGKKFEHYRQIASLREYLLVSQREPRIEQFIRKPDGRWEFAEASGLESHLSVPSMEINISLAEVFANVQFVRSPIRPAAPARKD